MGPLGIQETIFIFVFALLIFGPKKLPELGRTIGKAMTEFRRASSELKATFDREMNAIERETELKDVARDLSSDTQTASHNGNYDYNYDSYYDSGAYGSDSYDYSAQNSSTEGASATQGAGTTEAEQPKAVDASNSEPAPASDHPGGRTEDQPVKS
ncbi:MAG TPA: twin-arginine translocase TatA/TatE family subunit [Bryobacteraceae bacterium]|nr:twin-arginine translocase TatA/TatE family subunit [Bryobacteraceae bacterium]